MFSGDVFSPSVESSVTRGSHMVPVLNELGIDVSVTGTLIYSLHKAYGADNRSSIYR